MKNPTPTKAVAPTKAAVGKKPTSAKAQSLHYLAALDTEKKVEADNMKAEENLKDLNFKVDADFHTRFKMTATASGLKMKELLEECFDAWVKSRQGPQ